MKRDEVFEKLNEIFRDVFDDQSILINDSTTADDIEDWDSLTHISLIGAIEDVFSIKFDLSEILLLKNVGNFVDLIEIKLESDR